MVGYLPGLMQAAFGLPATVAGTVILPLVLGILSASIWSGRRTARTGRYRRFPIAGCALAAAGLARWRSSRTSTPPLVVGICTGVIGLGVGVLRSGDQRRGAGRRARPAWWAPPPRPSRSCGSWGSPSGRPRWVGSLRPACSRASARWATWRGGRRSSSVNARSLRHTYGEAYLSAMTPLFAALAVLFALAVVVAVMLPDRQLSERCHHRCR